MKDRRRPLARSGRALLLLIVMITATGPVALNIFVPSIPALQVAFQADFSTVQLTLTVYLVGMALGQLVYGPVADRLGRRPVLLVGLFFYFAGSGLCLFAPGIEILIAGRFLQAVGGCAGMALGRTIVVDLFPREEAVGKLAVVTMAMVVAPMIAPMLGGFLDGQFGWRASFVAVSAFGLALFAAVFRWLPETRRQPEHSPLGVAVPGISRLLHNRLFLSYALQSGFTTAGFFALLAGTPYVVINLMDRSAEEFGLYMASLAGAYIVGNFVSSRASSRAGIGTMILIGTATSFGGALLLAGLAAVSLVTNPAILFAPLLLLGFGNGITMPNSLVGAISVEPRLSGTSAGITGFSQMAMGAAVSYLLGLLMDETVWPMIWVVVLMSLLAVVTHQLRGRRGKPPVASA